MEIERKFLVDPKRFREFLRLKEPPLSVEDIEQGYIVPGVPTARVRYSKVTTHIGNGEFLTHTESTFTIKGASTVKSGALVRDEFETEIDDKQAKKLLEGSAAVLRKTRYHFSSTDFVIDYFPNYPDKESFPDGFYLAEIELSDEDEEFARPGWLGREVSEDPAFSSLEIAVAEALAADETLGGAR